MARTISFLFQKYAHVRHKTSHLFYKLLSSNFFFDRVLLKIIMILEIRINFVGCFTPAVL